MHLYVIVHGYFRTGSTEPVLEDIRVFGELIPAQNELRYLSAKGYQCRGYERVYDPNGQLIETTEFI